MVHAEGGITLGGSATAELVSIGDPGNIEKNPLISSTAEVFPPSLEQLPDLLLQASVVEFGPQKSEGVVVAGVAIAWFEIARLLRRDPLLLYQIHWRQLEEIIAAAYQRQGWTEVVLTPRSGDRGRDIIATKPGFGAIRIFDQVKAYKPGHLVTADDVRAMLGVLTAEANVSKGLVTTTSDFAPGIDKDRQIKQFMPYRLELKNGRQLIKWLTQIADPAAEPNGSS